MLTFSKNKWPIAESRVIYSGRFSINQDQLLLPDGGDMEYTWIKTGDAVAVLALTDDDQVVLTRQDRHPVGATILDLPAGGIEKDEQPIDAATRELAEETGFTAREIYPIGTFLPLPGKMSLAIHVFLARKLQVGRQSLDEHELMDVVLLDWREVYQGVLSDERVDGTLAYAVLRLAADAKTTMK